MHKKDLIWPLTLKYLKIIFHSDAHYNSILRSLVNLSSLLTLEVYQKSSGYYRPNGQSWENLIRSSLSLLKTFKSYFQFQYLPSSTDHSEVIASFSTSFYIRERNWFIHHDIPNKYPYHFIILNSLTFVFEEFMTTNQPFENSIATLSKDDKKILYSNI